jgi:predicted Holliday junction resolvase-like endonuclease
MIETRLDRKFNISHSPYFIGKSDLIVRKPVEGTNINTGEKIIFISTSAAEKAGFRRKNVRDCCNNKIIRYKGYTWKFLETTYGLSNRDT